VDGVETKRSDRSCYARLLPAVAAAAAFVRVLAATVTPRP
jgi:hypothetical protein